MFSCLSVLVSFSRCLSALMSYVCVGFSIIVCMYALPDSALSSNSPLTGKPSVSGSAGLVSSEMRQSSNYGPAVNQTVDSINNIP
jgi:hypothetical protein